MASSSSTGEEPQLVTTEAKMVVATGRDHCQQLKDMLNKEDTSSMVVVVASSNQTSTPNPRSPPPVMDPELLAVACSGSWKNLQSFLNGDHRPTSSVRTLRCCCFLWKKHQSFPPAEHHPTTGYGTIESSAIQQPSRDEEAQIWEALLDGVTVGGDTFLHVMATNSVGEDLIEHGLGLIHRKAVQFLSVRNKNGDTPLHCAARAAKYQMVSFLVDLARGNDASTVKPLLEIENHSGWTVLHEAVRVGNNDIVKVLMEADPELAIIPEDGTSPMYLAISLENKIIAEILYDMSGGDLSYSGPNGQNALHAAVLRSKDLTQMLLQWNNTLTMQPDQNGSTPLHVAASMLPTVDRRTIHLSLLESNPYQLYQPDNDGLFPTHLAASIDATLAIRDFLRKAPSCAGLRDSRGRTFLHVAVEKMTTSTVGSACINQSLSWILNMQDNDGNTALHLAVQKGSLTMFCALLKNRQVRLDLANEKGETPLDIARYKISNGLYYSQNSEAKIHRALKFASSKWGIFGQDYFEKNSILQARQDEIQDTEILKDSTQNLCIGSVLIATVTFGATFAMPGGYRSDDHTNGGTPTLAGRYAFDAFTLANALAFTLSAMAVMSLMSSGSPFHNTRSRMNHLRMAYYLMLISIKSLVAAFAIGTYVMLAPVAHTTAIVVCAMSSLVLIYQSLDMIIMNLSLIAPFRQRKGITSTFVWFVSFIAGNILAEYWPIIVIFCAAIRNYPARKLEPVV